MRGLPCLASTLCDVADRGADVLGAGGGLFHTACNLLRGAALFFDTRGDRGGVNFVDFTNCLRDALDGIHRVFGGLLDATNLLTDFLGCLCRLVGEILDLGGDHSEAFAGIPRSCRLDGRI